MFRPRPKLIDKQLLRAPCESRGDHIDLVEPTRAGDVQGLFPPPAERDVLAVRRRTSDGDGADVPALCTQDLDSSSGGDVEPAVVVDGHAVCEGLDSTQAVVP